MPESLPLVPLSLAMVVVLLGTPYILRTVLLEQKIALLQRLLLLQLVAVVAMALTILISSRDLPRLPVDADLAVVRTTVGELVDSGRQTMRWIGGLALLVVMPLPAVMHVLRQMGSFVLAHRTDLLARDQAALHGKPPHAAATNAAAE